MLLIRRSPRANNAVRTVSPAGELFVGAVVICMILAIFGEAADPTLFGEAGLGFAILDFSGELSLLALHHWHLLELLMAGAALAVGVFMARIFYAGLIRVLLPAGQRSLAKVPIEL